MRREQDNIRVSMEFLFCSKLKDFNWLAWKVASINTWGLRIIRKSIFSILTAGWPITADHYSVWNSIKRKNELENLNKNTVMI